MFDASFWIAFASIACHVANYNATARIEYGTRIFTKASCLFEGEGKKNQKNQRNANFFFIFLSRLKHKAYWKECNLFLCGLLNFKRTGSRPPHSRCNARKFFRQSKFLVDNNNNNNNNKKGKKKKIENQKDPDFR